MKALVKKLSKKGILASPEALKLLSEHENPEKIVEELLEEREEMLMLEYYHVYDFIKRKEEHSKETKSEIAKIPQTKAVEEEKEGKRKEGKKEEEKKKEGKGNEGKKEEEKEKEGKGKRKDLTNKGNEIGLVEGKTTETKSFKQTFHRNAVSRYRPIAAEVDEDIKVEGDITNYSRCEGNISDFSKLFHDRLNRLREMIKTVPKMAHARPIIKAKKSPNEVITIGIVTEVRNTKKGTAFTLEDEEDRINAFISKSHKSKLLKSVGQIVHDEVIGIIGNMGIGKGNNEPSVYPDKVFRPPVPYKHYNEYADLGISAAFVSDLHVGSKTFLGKEWDKAVDFLSGKDHELRDISSTIKYLIFPGDVVDGIGIYPNQQEDLDITDIYLQYEKVAEYIDRLPDHTHIIFMPGNHDSVRRTEPQPAFPDDIQKLFDRDRIHFVGNPVQLSLHGVKFNVYHGGGFDDLITAIPGLTYSNPIAGMKEMIKRRHLAPIYGGKTPIAPEKHDYLLMDKIPDVFVTGHVHTTQIDSYRDILLLNASTWMDQTDYQKMRDFVPDPAKLPVIKLDDLKPSLINFRG